MKTPKTSKSRYIAPKYQGPSYTGKSGLEDSILRRTGDVFLIVEEYSGKLHNCQSIEDLKTKWGAEREFASWTAVAAPSLAIAKRNYFEAHDQWEAESNVKA